MKVILVILACALSISSSNAQWFQQQQQSARCVNPNQRSGTCVSIYDCQTLMSVLQRTPNAIDREFVRASECNGGFGRRPHVCCTSDTGFTRSPAAAVEEDTDYYWGDSQAPTQRPQRRTVLFPSENAGGGDLPGRRQRGRGVPAATGGSSSSLVPQVPECGGVTIENKIYGGEDAELFEFPWMVLLEYNRRSGGISVNCAGSLINKRYVLTAAHCVTGAIEKVIGQLVAIRLGEHDTTKAVDCNQFTCAPEAFRTGIEEIMPHELYADASVNKENDIALVRLDRNVRFSDTTRPICLPSVVAQDQLRPGAQFTVAGWGRTLKSAKSAIKQKLNVGMVDQEQCRRKFLERRVNIADSHLCAGATFAQDSCEGDSGGPVMRFRGGAWVLEGIVSFGYKCGLEGWPAVYTRVSSFDAWIRSKLRA